MSLLKRAEAVIDPPEEERIGTWEDTGYRATDEEAHRNVRYDGSSSAKRIAGVFLNQMKLFSKNRWVFILMFSAVLMPVLALMPLEVGGYDSLGAFMESGCGGSTSYIGFLLCMMPLMASFFTAVLCGTQIPREFKDRTAYMSIPLPVTRMEFYLGKYLAGFVLCLGVFLLAFGFAVILAMKDYDTFFSGDIASALLCTVVMIFAYSATAFCMGTYMRRGSTLVPAAMMFFILPLLFVGVYLKFDLDAALYMPCFLPDAVVLGLGSPSSLSIAGMIGMFSEVSSTIVDGLVPSLIISIAWGAAFLALGAHRMNRREM